MENFIFCTVYEILADYRNCLLKLKNLLGNLFGAWWKYFHTSELVFLFCSLPCCHNCYQFFYKFDYRLDEHKLFHNNVFFSFTSLNMILLLLFSSIRPSRSCFELLFSFIWFVSLTVCLCRKPIIVLRTLFLFLGRLSLPLFLTKMSLEFSEFLLVTFSSAKNSVSLSFLVKSFIFYW